MKKKLSRKEKKSMLFYLEERFGLTKEVFKGQGLFKTQQKIYITTSACLQNPLFKEAETAGLAILRPNGVLKPTTDALQLFGKHAKKNTMGLSKEYAERFIRGEDLELSECTKEEQSLEAGYVIIKYNEHILGCANLKKGKLKNMLPKSRRIRIKPLIEK